MTNPMYRLFFISIIMLCNSLNAQTNIEVLRSEYEKTGDIIYDIEDTNEGSFNYIITSGNGNNYYDINETSGEISILNTIPDTFDIVHTDVLNISVGSSSYIITIHDAFDYQIQNLESGYTVLEDHNETYIDNASNWTAINNLWGRGDATPNVDFRIATIHKNTLPNETILIWDVPSKAEVFNGASVWNYNNVFWGNRINSREDLIGFPFQINQIESLDIAFDFEQLFGTEKFKIAMNMFMTDEDVLSSFSSNDGDFFFVFDQNGTFIPNYTNSLPDITIEGKPFAVRYDLNADNGYERRRVIVKDNEKYMAGNLDLKSLFDMFAAQSFLNEDQFIYHLQFGIEVTEGFGAIRFNQLNVNASISTIYYVDQQNGNNSNEGTTPDTALQTFTQAQSMVSPGDTIKIIGEYHNTSYNSSYTFGAVNDSHLWHSENTIKINNLNGTASQPITIMAYDENTVLKGDGANIFRITNSSYLNIKDFNIEGEVDNIPLSTANSLQFTYLIDDNTLQGSATAPHINDIKFRNEDETNDNDNIVEETDTYTDISNETVIRPSYIDTRGLYLSDCDNINIKNNTIHHTPGGGMRVSDSKNIDILENEIYRCSAKSYSGTHALVVTKTKPIGTNNYSIKIQKNEIHHNYNEQFSWSPSKTIITPKIDEGKGISLQRNNIAEWLSGSSRILVENNLCYWNGFSGVHTNDGHRIDFINNTCYLNSYTNTVTYSAGPQSGNNIGISAQSSDDIKMINNISVVDTAWNGSALSAGNSTNLVVSDNLIFGYNGTLNQDPDITAVQVNTQIADPQFINAGSHNSTSYDFGLQVSSPAIGIANSNFAPFDDFTGTTRDSSPDLGALEYNTGEPIPTTYTYNGSWSPSNPSGVSTSIDNIHIVTGNASSSGDNIGTITQANTLTIDSGSKLVIDIDGSLDIETIDNNGDLTIRSNSSTSGSLIVNSITNQGQIDYRKYVNHYSNPDGNDLISAPLTGEVFGDFAEYKSNEDNIYSNPLSSNEKLFGPFNKLTGEYELFHFIDDATEELLPAVGYRAASDPVSTNSNGIFVFTGDLTIDSITHDIYNYGTAFQRWNLIGNPYTSYIDFESFYNQNSAQFDDGPFNAIYGYNGISGEWTIWNSTTIIDDSETELIVPGQGFFVTSKTGGGTITFNPEMRRAGFSDDFITTNASQNLAKAKITLTKNNNNYSTQLFFLDNQTRALDVGYDAAAFNGNANGIFTNLVENSSGEKLAIQALPFIDLNNITIPLGIKANQGEQISIGLDTESLNLPSNINVYLEDNANNSWTLLNSNNYTITISENLDEIGRFYIHFQSETLNSTTPNIENIHVYFQHKTIIVNGKLDLSTSASLYDISGRLILEKELDISIQNNLINVSSLSSGIYLIQLTNSEHQTTKKVIIK